MATPAGTAAGMVIDEAVERSASPPVVALALDHLRAVHPDLDERLQDEGLRSALVAVLAASRSLTRLLLAEPEALAVLGQLDQRPRGAGDTPQALARWKRLELLRIAARDLGGLDPLEEVGANLARLGDDVLDGACRLAGVAVDGGADDPHQLAVIGMGKLGGCELNYSSDIDVLFVGSQAAQGAQGLARKVLEVARTCFRVDANLRPEGRDGPLARTVASYQGYWNRWASPWEFQALLKSRPAAGHRELGRAFAEAADAQLWGRPFGADELRSVRAMKARAESEVARRGLAERELKRGPGGIRDIEFAVQLLQLVHGRSDPALRSPTTLDALAELGRAGYVRMDDAEALADSYRFLRTVEHRLQLVDEQQVHAVPAGEASRAALARTLGYRDDAGGSALSRFETELRRHRTIAREIHQRLYFRPLLEAFAAAASTPAGSGALAPGAAAERLFALGFTDVERTRRALVELTQGLTRTSRLMQQMLPLLLGWLSESPDPDLGLLGLRTLASGPHQSARLVATFRDQPVAARRLCRLLGTSRRLTSSLERHPELIAALGDDRALTPLGRDALFERASTALAWRSSTDERREALRRFVSDERLRVFVADVLDLADVTDVGRAITAGGEALLEAALRVLEPPVPMAILALGRFGGAEMSYASDLDVVIVHEGATAAEAAAAEATAEALLRFINGPTPASRIATLDADLRPEGRQGPLSRSLDACASYYRRWAQTWERQAMSRARPVAGDPGVGQRFLEVIEPFVWQGLTDEHIRDIRRMKARVERERIPRGDDPAFHLKLGRGALADVEWTAQLLQLRHGVRSPGTMAALDALEGCGLLAHADARTMRESYRFCERTRDRWFLVKGTASDALPARSEELTRLARSLDTTAAELRDEYRRVTRRCRQVVERLFYGREE